MDRGPENERGRQQHLATGIVLGVAIGAGLGLALDNLALRTGMGGGDRTALGVDVGAWGNRGNDERDRPDD